MKTFLGKVLRQVRRLIVAMIGMTVLIIGVALIVLPGPAFLVIPAGLFILSTEFEWAAKLLSKLREKLKWIKRPPSHNQDEK